MEPFRHLRSVAAPLLEDNVDTDVVFPARFLLLLEKKGLGRYLFHDRRFDSQGAERADFVLNRAGWRESKIMVVGSNFGCGSSREQAVWALADFGIRCIIAPSFADIFMANCVSNGVLPVVLDKHVVLDLARHAELGEELMVDLGAQLICSGVAARFEMDPELRTGLMKGLDATTLILRRHLSEIEAFEARHLTVQPWLFDAS